MKLWDKGIQIDKFIENFTIGKDRELDIYLAPYDVLGSIAHAIMLEKTGLLKNSDLKNIKDELILIYNICIKQEFVIEPGIEDVHSQVELLLTRKLGDAGKKIHTARSRNDQVIVDLKLYTRDEIRKIVERSNALFELLIQLSDKNKDILIPGYTHLQVAMPSSFGLWFGAYAESLTDDMQLLLASYKITNQNPLGSAAGYGSSFHIDRQLTTDLLGFDRLNYNVIYAQMSRGKTERVVAYALGSLAATLSKLATDVCLFASQNFGFLKLPDEFTTGSSIMPHKKNPDVFELIRARCNKIQNLPNEINLITGNLTSGYFRDLQILKETFIPVFEELKGCIDILIYALSDVKIVDNILQDERYKYVFSVEEVNKLVIKGVPFREAYKEVAAHIKNGTYNPDFKIKHTHEGSIGNLCNDKISDKMKEITRQFNFTNIDKAFKFLLKK